MAKEIRYHFYLKNIKSEVPTPINFVMNKGSFRRKVAVGEKILPLWWDVENECAIEDSRQKKQEKALAKRVNRNLTSLRSDLDELFEQYNGIEMLSPNHTDGVDYLEELFARAAAIIGGKLLTDAEEAKASRMTPTQFFEEFVERWGRSANKRTGVIPKAETMWNYANTIRRYKDFIVDNGRKDSFAIFDENFQTDFDDYLLNEQSLVMNTIVSTHSQLKVMLRRAYEKGLLRDPSFMHWSSKTINFTKIYLNDDELNAIYGLELTEAMRIERNIKQVNHIIESRDLFIMSSRTGLRYSDLKHLNSATWIMEEGKESLTINVQKTSERITIPLHKQVIELYNKYGGEFPEVVSKSHYNDQIRLCAELAGINTKVETFEWEKGRPVIHGHKKFELISSHTGRRSFCTNLFLKCKSAQYVMSLSGHKTEESFRRYLCVDQAEMAEMVRKYINLDYEGENNATFERLVSQLRQDTLTIDKQQRQIVSLGRSAEEQRIIAEEVQKDLQAVINNQQFAMALGLTLAQYEHAQKQADAIADLVN